MHRFATDRVDNLILAVKENEGLPFGPDGNFLVEGPVGTFRLEGRCVIVRTEHGDMTPLFVAEQDLILSDEGISLGGGASVRFGQRYTLLGHRRAEFDPADPPDIGDCPKQGIFIVHHVAVGRQPARPPDS